MTYVLDTNIITAILKGNNKVQERAKSVIREGEDILINAISYYEIKRGLLAINALKQIEIFDRFCEQYGLVLLDTQLIFDKAAEIYADLHQRGQLLKDADILIASIVNCKDFILVSDDSDFNRIPGLKIENWL